MTERITTSEDKSTNRKEQLKEIACELFMEKGFEATSMSLIAKQAGGLSKRTPYIYYESKHDLFSAVVHDFLLELEDILSPLWNNEKSAADNIIACIKTYSSYAINNPEKFQLIMTFEKRDFYPGRQQALLTNALACQKTNDRITIKLQETVKLAMENEALLTAMTAQQYSLLLWSALSGVISIALERQDLLADVYDWSAQDMVDQFIQSFLNPKK